MSEIEKTDVQVYIEQTLRELVDAAKEGISTLIADVKRPIADDVADERRKSALESKKKAFMDAQEMLSALASLENKIVGKEIEEENNNNSFKGGFSEKYAKKK
jgi:antitoxin (DNA-binding transcriptional repressor) of toxin-antitoxin stability system